MGSDSCNRPSRRESVIEDPLGDPTISVPCTGGMSTESTAKVGKQHCSGCLLAEDHGWVGGGKRKRTKKKESRIRN